MHSQNLIAVGLLDNSIRGYITATKPCKAIDQRHFLSRITIVISYASLSYGVFLFISILIECKYIVGSFGSTPSLSLGIVGIRVQLLGFVSTVIAFKILFVGHLNHGKIIHIIGVLLSFRGAAITEFKGKHGIHFDRRRYIIDCSGGICSNVFCADSIVKSQSHRIPGFTH